MRLRLDWVERHAGKFAMAGVLAATLLAVKAFQQQGQLHAQQSQIRSLLQQNTTRIAAAEDANCKLKLYDEVSGVAGSQLFARLNVLSRSTAAEVREALEIVASIPSAPRCDATTKPSSGAPRHRVHLPTLRKLASQLEHDGFPALARTVTRSAPAPRSPRSKAEHPRTAPRATAPTIAPPTSTPAAPAAPSPSPSPSAPQTRPPSPLPPGPTGHTGPVGLPCPPLRPVERLLCR